MNFLRNKTGGVHAALGYFRKASFRVLALTEDRFGRVVTVKPFRTYAAAALLVSFCVGLFAGGSVGSASFIFVVFCYPAVRLLFAIFRRLGWSLFC